MAELFDPFSTDNTFALEEEKQQRDSAVSALQQAAAPERPMFAQGPGQFLDELGNIAGNAVFGLGTDLLDIGAGLADVAVEGTKWMVTGEADASKLFDDSDNPWTQWRQKEFAAETQAGEFASNIVRVGTLIATLPKVGIKGLAVAPRLLSKAGALGPIASGAGKAAKALDKVDDAMKASRYAAKTQALGKAAEGFGKGTAAKRAATIAKSDDWLTLTFKQVSQVPEGANWLTDLRKSTKALTQLTREKARFRTVAEALAWDAFAAFNVAGEGDWAFDETLSDTLNEWGLPSFGGLRTDLMDAPMERKIKQMAEGLAVGGILSALLDMSRVYRYSRNFRNASPEQQAEIVKALNAEAEELGTGIAQLQGFVPEQWTQFTDPWMTPNTTVTQRIAAGGARGVDDFADPNVSGSFADNVAGSMPAGAWNPATMDPWANGGALATLRNQVDTELIAQNYKRDLDAAYIRANANSPVQNRLAQMEGLASPLNEDPLYQEWLASRAPDELFMPPQAGGNPALEQFQQQGAMPAPSTQGGPGDLEAYKQWLESRARMPDAELDPRVQQSLRRLEGIGELALRQPEGLAMPAGQLGQPAQMGNLPQLPGGPEAKPPGAPPAALLGAGGEMVPVTPGIQPVNVVDLGPRPPAPTVTPQTIRSAFQADIYNAFRRSQELTFEEGPDGVMRSVDEMRGSIKQLLPRNRVDAIEYINSFTPVANELGVINASDSVWMNFITNRGLTEGWASIDPDTMQVRFNRRSALELDQGDLAVKQAESLDQLNELNRYQEWLWNKELVNGNPQMRPEVQDNLAAKEARDAYDQWEAGQTAQRMAEPDPAKLDAERQAVTAAVEADQLNNAEELRLTAAEQAALSGQLDDATAVREYLGTTLDSVQRPEVAKVEVGRGWEVLGADGEVLATTRTKREAERLADRELQRLREAMVNRARQMEVDATDQAMTITTGDPIYDSSVVGKVTLTETQIRAVERYSQPIQRQLRLDMDKRTGGQAFFNVNDIKGGKRTFEMTQGEMYDLVDGIKALLQTGEIKGSEARVLRNIADKMDTGMRLLEPEARAQRFADGVAADASRFLDHGDFC